MQWMAKQARAEGLQIEQHLANSLNPSATAKLHQSRKHIYRSKRPFYRPIDHGGEILLHRSVKQRWEADAKYRPVNLKHYVEAQGWPQLVD
jgi:hypothetical protein